VQADIDEAIATATTPDIRLIVALAAVHAARPKMIRTMQLDGRVPLGEPRSTFPKYPSASVGSISHSGRPNQARIWSRCLREFRGPVSAEELEQF